MAEDASAWKQRYELALEAIERTARDNREFTQELVRGLNRLTLASEGQDHELDIELRELRAFLRMKALSREVLSSKLDVLEERLRELSRSDRKIDHRLESAITTLLDQVDTGKQPRETQRASQLLRKELRGLDPLDALLRAVALRADVQPREKPDTPPASGGILERWFGARATEAAPAKAAPVANTEPPRAEAQKPPPPGTGPQDQPDPASSFLDDGSKKILVELLEMLEPPESIARLHADYSAVRQRLDRNVRLGDLSHILEEVLLLTRSALEQSRQEFSVFLEQLSSRLVSAAETIAEGGHLDAERKSNSNTLDTAMRDGIEHIRHQISGTRDLQTLKQEVNKRLDGIGQAFESFREQEERIGSESAAGVRALAERVIELQQKTRDAELMIEEQRRLAHTDTLTRLPNREAWTNRLQQEYQRWQRYRRPLALAVCDIDRFKNVNDRFGHAVGDAVLRAVGECVSSQLRKTDFVARFGGEEFVFLLPETTPEQAKGAMDKVREAIAALSIDAGGRKAVTVTASFGVAGFAEDDEPDRVFTRADTALYQAKAAGRDCVVNYSAEPG
jgi:diguanylate cyclase